MTSEMRVASRFLVEQVVREVASTRLASESPVTRTELGSDLVRVVASSAAEDLVSGRVTVASVSSRIKEFIGMMSAAPKAWEQIKEALGIKPGVQGLASIPGKVKSMLDAGRKMLGKIGKAVMSKVEALRIFVEVGKNLVTVGKWLEGVYDKLPAPVRSAVSKIGSKFKTVAAWLDDLVSRSDPMKVAGRAASAAIYAFIWFNVTEVSWDVPEILRGFLGGFTFSELVMSLPEAGVGFLLSVLFPGIPQAFLFNAFFPITVALRLAYLYKEGLVSVADGKVSLRV